MDYASMDAFGVTFTVTLITALVTVLWSKRIPVEGALIYIAVMHLAVLALSFDWVAIVTRWSEVAGGDLFGALMMVLLMTAAGWVMGAMPAGLVLLGITLWRDRHAPPDDPGHTGPGH